MEHLPWQNGLVTRPRTPYMCEGFEDSICDSLENFASWPDLAGWVLDPNLPTAESARQCQAWLFFGFIKILTEAIGQVFSLEVYIDVDNSAYVNTSELENLLGSARIRLFRFGWGEFFESFDSIEPISTKVPTPGASLIYGAIASALHQHHTWLRIIIERYDHSVLDCNPWDHELFNVFWSSIMLLESFNEIGLEATLYKPRDEHNILGSVRSLPQFGLGNQALGRALRATGGCPTTVERVNLQSLDIYRLCEKPRSSRTKHVKCDRRHCSAGDINVDCYTMYHADSCAFPQVCEQGKLGPSHQALTDIIEAGSTPVIRSTLNSEGILQVEAVDGADIDSVTAISHVWAGGLGNFEENSHFECQLLQLHRDILRVRGGRGKLRGTSIVYYWFDTLCIPAKAGPLKTRAIDAMAAVYAKCSHMLVIDPDLRHTDSAGMKVRERDLAIMTSQWMARSWTFQEGALSVNVYFKFSDNLVSYSSLSPRMSLTASTMIQSLWSQDIDLLNLDLLKLRGLIGSFRALFPWVSSLINLPFNKRLDFTPSRLKFSTIWNELCDRSSTKPEDIAAIFAVCLGHSAAELLAHSGNKRMQGLMRSQDVLPVSILFVEPSKDKSSWSPILPSCAGSRTLLTEDLGVMTFSEDGRLRVSELKNTRLLYVSGPISVRQLEEMVHVHDAWRYGCYRMHFPYTLATRGARTIENLVFMLPFTDSPRGNQGLCLEVVQHDSTGLGVKYFSTVTWTKQTPRPVASSSRTTSLQHFCEFESSGKIALTKTFTSHLSDSTFREDYPLLIDIDVKTWPKLKWSRQEYYPFLEAMLRVAQPLHLFMFLPLGSILYFMIYFFISCIGASYEKEWLKLLASVVSPLIFTVLRLQLARVEADYLCAMIRRQVQRIWATSFDPVGHLKAPPLLIQRQDRAELVLVAAIYLTVFMASTAAYITLLRQWIISEHGSHIMRIIIYPMMPRTASSSTFTVVCKPVFFSISCEVITRIIVFILVRPWRAYTASPLLPEDAQRTHESQRDLRYDWLLSAVKLFLAVVIILWSAFVVWVFKVATHGELDWPDRPGGPPDPNAGGRSMKLMAVAGLGILEVFPIGLLAYLSSRRVREVVQSITASMMAYFERLFPQDPDREIQL